MRTTARGGVTFRSDARRLAAGAPNGDLSIWDTSVAHRTTLISRIRRGRGIRAAAWNPSAVSILATSSADGTATIWQTVDDRPPHPLSDAPLRFDGPQHLGWFADGSYLFCVTRRGQVAVWHARDTERYRRPDRVVAGEVVAAYPTSASIIMVTADGWGHSWDPGLDVWRRIRLDGASIVACARSGPLVAVARSDGRVDVLDEFLAPIGAVRSMHREVPHALAFSDDGRLLITASRDGTVTALESGGAMRWQTSSGTGLPPAAIAVAGGLVAVGGGVARPPLFDLETGCRIEEA